MGPKDSKMFQKYPNSDLNIYDCSYFEKPNAMVGFLGHLENVMVQRV